VKAQLIVVYGKPRNTIKTLPLGDCLIGRGEECQVRTNSPLVSRQHCLVHVTKDEAILRDLGSTNGTLVNGKRVLNERQLVPGDLLQIGPVVFEFRDESADAVSSAQTIRVDPGTKVSTDELPVVELIEPSSVHSRSFQSESTQQLTGGR
jgi:pSer/pThr/pTyr-binding forkhead associated (FHA) protein